jgi:uridylate kinase
MLATIMNALAIESILNKHKIAAVVASALDVDSRVAQKYVNEIAIKNLKCMKVVIFGGGTGRPYFTTDTTATLVAAEIGADVVLLAKNNTDGVFDKDPNKFADAKHFDHISYEEILEKDLLFMDTTATSMAKTNNLKLLIFDINKEDAILKVLENKIRHTKIGF